MEKWLKFQFVLFRHNTCLTRLDTVWILNNGAYSNWRLITLALDLSRTRVSKGWRGEKLIDYANNYYTEITALSSSSRVDKTIWLGQPSGRPTDQPLITKLLFSSDHDPLCIFLGYKKKICSRYWLQRELLSCLSPAGVETAERYGDTLLYYTADALYIVYYGRFPRLIFQTTYNRGAIYYVFIFPAAAAPTTERTHGRLAVVVVVKTLHRKERQVWII